MGNVLKKNFPSATCLHCKKVTDIQFSKAYRSLTSQNKTLKESLKFNKLMTKRIHTMKNAQIQSLHGVIKRLLDLMDDKQKEKAKEVSQFMREELKHAEQKAFK